jgi:hypothetical protein
MWTFLIGNLLTNPALSGKIANFKEATFVNVYPKGLVNHPEWLFGKLNEVSNAQYSTFNSPFVELLVTFTPADNFTGYLITIQFKGDSKIKAEWMAAANEAAGTLLGVQKFASPREARDKVNEAIFRGLDVLQTQVGTTFMPDMAIRYQDELYLNGQTLEVWQRSDSIPIILEPVNGQGQLLSGNLMWIGARKRNDQAAEFIPYQNGQTTVSITKDSLRTSMFIKVKEFSIKPEEIIKSILIEVINESIAKARSDLDKIKNDTADVSNQISNLISELNAKSPLFAGNLQVEFQEEPVSDERDGTIQELDDLRKNPKIESFVELNRKYFRLAAQLVLQIKIEVLISEIINDPSKINEFVQLIKTDSPEFIAEVLINFASSEENRIKLKVLVINFFNKKINEMASR